MTRPHRVVVRRWLAVLALGALLVPAWAAGPRLLVFFFADFDASASSSGADRILAQGGDISFDPAIFSVESSGVSGNKVLLIAPNPGPQPAELYAELDESAFTDQVDISWDTGVLVAESSLGVCIEDDGGSGMIDLDFDDDGTVTIDGQSVPMPSGSEDDEGQESGAYDFSVRLTLRQGMLGVKTWSLSIMTATSLQQVSGPLLVPGDLSVGAVRFTRPAAPPLGSYTIDNLRVTAPGFGNSTTSSQ